MRNVMHRTLISSLKKRCAESALTGVFVIQEGGEFSALETYGAVTIRIATTSLFIAGALASVAAPIPVEMPAIALGQVVVYRLEILLALVYGGLLLLTPFFHGVMRGQVPIELSHRGAKWQANAAEGLAEAEREIAQVKKERDILKSKHSADEEPQ